MKSYGNIKVKGENAGNHDFLLFPQCFIPFTKQFKIFSHIYLFILSSAMLLIWTTIKLCCIKKSVKIGKYNCLCMSYSSKIQTVLYDLPLFPIMGKSSNGENGYYQHI